MEKKELFVPAIYIEKVEDRELLKASVYGGLQSFKMAAAAEELTTKVFPCEEESLPEVKAWLEEQRTAFFA